MNKAAIAIALVLGLTLNLNAGYKKTSRPCVSYSLHNSPSYSHSRYSSGYYEYINQRIWVPACRQRAWIPARYEYRKDCHGSYTKIMIYSGRYEYRQIPGYYTYKQVRVWRSRPVRHYNSGINIHWSL